jgi:hypothetical protein
METKVAAFLSGRSSQATPPMVSAPAIEAIMPHRVMPPEVLTGTTFPVVMK